jgi:hypothetical protein
MDPRGINNSGAAIVPSFLLGPEYTLWREIKRVSSIKIYFINLNFI